MTGTPPAATPPPPAAPPAPAHRSFGTWLWEWTKSIAVALVVWFLLRTFLLEAFSIPSSSMERTLLVGDFLFVNKALYGAEVPVVHSRLPAIREPERGEIIVFDSVEEENLKVVKRLIGVPGDTIGMVDGRLQRNGVEVPEPYIIPADPTLGVDPLQRARMRAWQLRHVPAGVDTAAYHPDTRSWGPIVVPPDSYFVMGDNRGDSYDSRYWGFLPRLNVRGTPMFIYYSYDRSSWKPIPMLSAVRWGRIFSHPD
jgi:signal peptidase I